MADGEIRLLSLGSDKQSLKPVIAKLLAAKKIIAVAGAGISVSAGIPDFRSAGGLYDKVKEKFPDLVLRGQELFDARFYANPRSRPAFLSFIASLRALSAKAVPTTTHTFFHWLNSRNQLLRLYSQNIDGLELVLNASNPTSEGDSDKDGRPNSNNTDNNYAQTDPKHAELSEQRIEIISSVEAEKYTVFLHGRLDKVCCVICKAQFEWGNEFDAHFIEGNSPECPTCSESLKTRVSQGKRRIAVGHLRPNIVLYNEPHPMGDTISQQLQSDIRKNPTVLMIWGTSLKVAGLKRLVRDVAKTVHASSNGIVILVDIKPAKAEWKGVVDVQLLGECDRWAETLKSEMERFEKVTKLDSFVRKTKVIPAAAKGSASANFVQNETTTGERSRKGSKDLDNKPKGAPKSAKENITALANTKCAVDPSQ